jgi:hypothetical protein
VYDDKVRAGVQDEVDVDIDLLHLTGRGILTNGGDEFVGL